MSVCRGAVEEEEEEEEEDGLFKADAVRRRRKGEKERLQRKGGRGRQRERGATRLMDKENVREYERV